MFLHIKSTLVPFEPSFSLFPGWTFLRISNRPSLSPKLQRWQVLTSAARNQVGLNLTVSSKGTEQKANSVGRRRHRSRWMQRPFCSHLNLFPLLPGRRAGAHLPAFEIRATFRPPVPLRKGMKLRRGSESPCGRWQHLLVAHDSTSLSNWNLIQCDGKLWWYSLTYCPQQKASSLIPLVGGALSVIQKLTTLLLACSLRERKPGAEDYKRKRVCNTGPCRKQNKAWLMITTDREDAWPCLGEGEQDVEECTGRKMEPFLR